MVECLLLFINTQRLMASLKNHAKTIKLRILIISPVLIYKNVKIALLQKVTSQEIPEIAGQRPVIQFGKYLNTVWSMVLIEWKLRSLQEVLLPARSMSQRNSRHIQQESTLNQNWLLFLTMKSRLLVGEVKTGLIIGLLGIVGVLIGVSMDSLGYKCIEII